MNLLLQHWSFDPFIFLVGALVIVHSIGHGKRMQRLRSRGTDTRPYASQAVLFYAGLALLLIAVVSPVDYWSDSYLFVHMIQHIVLAFFVPPLIVLGAPWLSLLRGLPIRVRRWYGFIVRKTHDSSAASRIRAVLTRPVTSVVLFNATMVFWHFPGPFDLALRNGAVHVWLEHGSFFVFGVAFWFQIVGSRPFHPLLPFQQRTAALLTTNVVMVLVAMTLGLFSGTLYAPYLHVPHPLFSAYADQQIAAGTLWVCGDFSIMPALYWTVVAWLHKEEQLARPTIEDVRTSWIAQRQSARR